MEEKKVIYMLKSIYNSNNHKALEEIVDFSTFEFKKYKERFLTKEWDAYSVMIRTEHNIYCRIYSQLETYIQIIKDDLNKLISTAIEEIQILPDYEKINISNGEIRPIFTDWEEINKAQADLLAQLKKTSTDFDIKNIGNTSRSILKILARLVFKKERHIPKDLSIQLDGDKYKNQLQTYIQTELLGKSNSELRKFSETAIDLIDDSIALANSITHRDKAEKHIAEVCVTGVITVISIISFIEKH